jgi:Fungal specific transcription factor domain
MLVPSEPRSHNKGYHIRLKALEDKIGSLPIMPVSTTFGADDAVAVEVYQMAARIYFARASMSSWKLSSKIESVINDVFAGPLPAHPCGHFFPVFILACETRTDERRTAILNLIDRIERNDRIRGIERLRHTFQSIWVQQDLHADSDLLVNYLGMMSAVISSSNAPFSFVLAS